MKRRTKLSTAPTVDELMIPRLRLDVPAPPLEVRDPRRRDGIKRFSAITPELLAEIPYAASIASDEAHARTNGLVDGCRCSVCIFIRRDLRTETVQNDWLSTGTALSNTRQQSHGCDSVAFVNQSRLRFPGVSR